MALLFLSLFFARAVVSISIGLMALVWLIDLITSIRHKSLVLDFNKKENLLAILFAILWMLVLADGIFRGFSKEVSRDLVMKLPLLFIPGYLIRLKVSFNLNEFFFGLLAGVITLVAVISSINYLLHFEEINLLLLQSKHIPVFGGTHHIYFGMYLSVAVWMSAYYVVIRKSGWFWKINLIVQLLCLHLLASRTGLVGFYFSVFLLVVWLFFRIKETKIKSTLILGAVIIPIVAYLIIPSLHNKVKNSIQDFQSVNSGKDLNYKSLAMRIEAWKSAWYVIQRDPFTGTGLRNAESRLQEAYDLRKSELYPENRIGPHNEFLESWLVFGVAGFILITLLFILMGAQFRIQPIVMVITGVLLVSFLLESVLERQLGIIITTIFLLSALQSETPDRLIRKDV